MLKLGAEKGFHGSGSGFASITLPVTTVHIGFCSNVLLFQCSRVPFNERCAACLPKFKQWRRRKLRQGTGESGLFFTKSIVELIKDLEGYNLPISNVWDLDIDIDGHSAENISIIRWPRPLILEFLNIYFIYRYRRYLY